MIATLRVTIPTGHTSAPVTAATLEMDAPVKVPSDRDLLAQFLRDSKKNIHKAIRGRRFKPKQVQTSESLSLKIQTAAIVLQ